MLTQKKHTLRSWISTGELWIWMNAAAVGLSIAAVTGLLLLIAVRGLDHFWPSQLMQITLNNEPDRVIVGEFVESEEVPAAQYLGADAARNIAADEKFVERWLIKTGNRRVDPPDFEWVFTHYIDEIVYPERLVVFERTEWGNAYGWLVGVREAGNDVAVSDEDALWEAFLARLARADELRESIREIEMGEYNRINYALEEIRLDRRSIELDQKLPAERRAAQLAELETQAAQLEVDYRVAEAQLAVLAEDLARDQVIVQYSSGKQVTTPLQDIVRAWQPNRMSLGAKLSHYFASIWLFLSDDPREANTEGGIFPAIFGTVMMVLLMSVLVTPLGVIAAVYLREYARQGPLVRLVRIAVNNLAGVPSIVYGVFGLGFFVYFIGGNIDQLFFSEALPAPTFGTPGLLWASLTLALLTVPVVVVSTEEGLTRIPRSLREGSLALGATKAETLFKVILPVASPSILTGVILAIARAAGEVAPLMLVGVVKLAPALPMDGNFPYLHLERKFMHLGFHIFDVGFQSPNVEAARPLVYSTALLLVLIIIILNLTAIMLRSRLENRYRGVEG
jgi:phosphate transport system permease protein